MNMALDCTDLKLMQGRNALRFHVKKVIIWNHPVIAHVSDN